MSQGRMLVTFSAIETAASDTDATAAQIDQQLDDLKAYLAPMVSTWTGQAAAEYQALQQKWDTSAAELNAVLREISGALRTAGQNYQQAERENTSIWGA